MIKSLEIEGKELKFLGTSPFWFTNIKSDADELLEVGKVYKAKSGEMYSSWTSVVLEDFPNKTFNFHWFNVVGEPERDPKQAKEWLSKLLSMEPSNKPSKPK